MNSTATSSITPADTTGPPTNEIDALANKIEQEAEFLAENSHTARVIVDFFKHVDQQIKTGSHNTVDLKIVLAFGIAGFTILEVGASAATPVWVTLSMFGLNHLIEANTHEAARPDGRRRGDAFALA